MARAVNSPEWARVKDVVEDKLYSLVCDPAISLTQAYVGAPAPSPAQPAPAPAQPGTGWRSHARCP